MKKHVIAIFLGMITIWLLTSFIYADINPFNLPSGIRSGMVVAYGFTQILIHFAIAMYNDLK